MYKLYDMNTREKLEESDNELVIVDAIGYEMSNNDRANYMVINNERGYDSPDVIINNVNDYVKYLNRVKSKYTKQTKQKTKKLTKNK